MFATANTYRQATWQPDALVVGSLASTGQTSQVPLQAGTSGASNLTGAVTSTQLVGTSTLTHSSTKIITAVSKTLMDSAGSGTTLNQINGTINLQAIINGVSSVGIFQTSSVTTQGSAATFGAAYPFTISFKVVSEVSFQTSATYYDLFGRSTSMHSIITMGTSYTYTTNPFYTQTLFPTSTNAPPTISSQSTSSLSTTSGLSASSTASSSSVTSSTGNFTSTQLGTSVVTTVTTTSAEGVNISSTTTETATHTLWSIGAGNPFVTTSSFSTTTSTLATTTAARALFTTVSTATPSWYGWNSDVGTVILVTGNSRAGLAGDNDLAAWSQATAAGLDAQWNWTFGTQTTLWGPQPIAQANQSATTLSSQITNVTSISVLWSAALTMMGISTFTTSTTETAISNFADSVNIGKTAAALPFVTIQKTITSFSTYTSTATGLINTPINTTLISISFTNNAIFPPVTELLTGLTIASTNGSLATTISYFTYVPGYTTASIAIGIGIVGGAVVQLISTEIVSGSNLSLTTTTATARWFYDTSCPTVIATSTTVTSTTSTSSPGAGTISVTRIATIATGGGSFTKNLFTTPSVVGPGGPAFLAPTIASWRAAPTMQGFAPWTATTATYQQLAAPPEVAELLFQPFATGAWQSFNSRGGPITTTARGIWALAPIPVTTTWSTTVTTTGAPTTKATTWTSIAFYTLSSTTTAGSTSFTFSLKFPTNLDQAAADVYATTKSTSGTSSSSGSTSYPAALSVTNAVTSTFAESDGFTATSFAQATIDATTTAASQFGIGFTRPVTLLTTTVTNYAVTFTLRTTSSGAGIQFFPGIGGTPKYTAGAGTIFACGAAISLYGQGSTSWSSADPNFFMVVIGGTLTTSSSTTSNLGAGVFNVYSFPGEASLISGPCISFTTDQNRLAPPASVGTAFWLAPDPPLLPNQGNALNTTIK